MYKTEFIGLDIETTGLDPSSDAVLEIGLVAFSQEFEPLRAKSWLTLNAELTANYASRTSQTVVDMHSRNGLYKEISALTSHQNHLYDQIVEMEDFIEEESQGRKLPLVGSSIAFDRGFLRDAFVWHRILNCVHYRSVDATSVLLAHQAFHPGTEDEINLRKDVIRNRMLRDLPSWTPRVPHRPIFDLASSAALIQAVHDHQSQ